MPGSAPFSCCWIWKPPGVKMTAKDNQNPPYEDSAVAPNVFPTAISLWREDMLAILPGLHGYDEMRRVGETYHMPASN